MIVSTCFGIATQSENGGNMNLFEALDVFSGYITMFSEMGILSDEELTELELAEATIRKAIAKEND